MRSCVSFLNVFSLVTGVNSQHFLSLISTQAVHLWALWRALLGWHICFCFQTHYLIYGKGFQTWEYSPVYAIRSYAYLLLHAWPAAFHARILQTNKVRAGWPGSTHIHREVSLGPVLKGDKNLLTAKRRLISFFSLFIFLLWDGVLPCSADASAPPPPPRTSQVPVSGLLFERIVCAVVIPPMLVAAFT